jgi:3-hydroxyisobutyrate dehydrogenase-like beta-hydroxyacid dehydrogenase
VARAEAAGMVAASDAEIASADFILSILPPSDAPALAQRLGKALKASDRKAVYVDSNAVSPQTVPKIAAPILAAGARFVDAGIIGGPPQPGKPGPAFYASGPDAPLFAALADHGLDVRVLPGPLSAASALKMSYGGITKGVTAIATAMILAATRGGSSEALLKELQASFAPMPWISQHVPGMYHRAYRWVGEMEEVSQFVSEDAAARDMYRGIAQLYDRIAKDFASERREVGMLDAFFKPTG